MKSWSVLATLTLLVLFFSVTPGLQAQEEEEARDILELCLSGGLGLPMSGLSDWHDSLGTKTGWSLGIDFGYFMKDNIVVGINFQYTQFGIDGPPEVKGAYHRLYNPNIYAKYYFVGESDLEPYIKAHIGIENPKFTTSMMGPKYRAISYDASLAYGIGAGLFYYRSDYSGLYIEANYHAANTSSAQRVYATEELNFKENIGVFDIHAGVRLLVGSDE